MLASLLTMLTLAGNPIATFAPAAELLPSTLPAERLGELDELAATIAGGQSDLVFICTHNSRRSHMAQLWAQAAAFHVGLNDVKTYSGGTEVTAFNPRAVAALERAGWTAEIEGTADRNPVRRLSAAGVPAQRCWSKRYDDASNPPSGFIAVMTCSEADGACPVVFGASARFSLPYIDPKISDGTPEESDTYDARSAQIASEMLYVMQTAARLRGGLSGER
ncbi:MAG: protein-tyrosine-phosphatase [Flavobacteriales bacterium]|jgi:arsenate reductase